MTEELHFSPTKNVSEPPLTSLALYRVSVAPSQDKASEPVWDPFPGVKRCPRKLDWCLFNAESGHMLPARCRANTCDFCLKVNALQVAGAIALAQPERAVRFSQVGDDWQTARNRMKQIAFHIRNSGYDWHCAWHLEPNPKGTGHHIHAWQYGSYIPQATLQDLAHREGMGIPYIEAMKQNQGPVNYGLKQLAVKYGLKGVDESAPGEYLRKNGGRLVHSTRGFWKTPDGQLEGQRAAMREFTKRSNWTDEEEGPVYTMTRIAPL